MRVAYNGPVPQLFAAVSLEMWGFVEGCEVLFKLVNIVLMELGDTQLKERWIHQSFRRGQTVCI